MDGSLKRGSEEVLPDVAVGTIIERDRRYNQDVREEPIRILAPSLQNQADLAGVPVLSAVDKVLASGLLLEFVDTAERCQRTIDHHLERAAGDLTRIRKEHADLLRAVRAARRPSFSNESQLTARKIQVLTPAASGMRNQDIATRLSIGKETVKSYLNTGNRGSATSWMCRMASPTAPGEMRFHRPVIPPPPR
ncbi:MAG: LuxR C-terminal-related transcriptional regulator [Candidatus Dormibacteria bacterium]|jgi:hypothetical protein